MQDFLSTVILLFIVIDPVGLAPMIQGMLKKYSPAQQKAILTRELVFALSLLLLFFFSGKFLLNLLGLEPSTLSISGGILLFLVALGMVLPSLSPAEMRQREPRQLAAAWQEVKKQIADDGKTIRVRDGIQALELLAELGISSVPADGVRLSRGSLTIVVTRGKKEDGIFYVLAVKEEGGASLEVKMVPPS